MQTIIVKRTETKFFPNVGEYMKTFAKDGRLILYTRCPECKNIIALDSKKHTITIKEDKITVHPSIVCPIDICKWHVFLRDGNYV